MTIHPLLNEERSQFRATHRVVVTAADLQALAGGNGAQSVSTAVVAINTGAFLEFAYLKTPFTFSDGTLLSVGLTVGDSASANRYLTTMEVENTAAGGFSTVQGGVAIGPVLKAYNAADSILCTFTPTAGKNLNTCTNGELHLYLNLQNVVQ